MKTLTDAQRRTLFATVRDAARELGEEPEAYRKRIMLEECGAGHLAEVSRTSGYDKLMARACRDAGDDARAIAYAASSTDRLRHLILAAARRIAPDDPHAYIAGVMVRSRTVTPRQADGLSGRLATGSGWLDFTDGQLRRILAMLDTHLRRT